jgi:hypothetical protein
MGTVCAPTAGVQAFGRRGNTRRRSQRRPESPFACHPQPSIWVAERLQNGVSAEGDAEEIPGNGVVAHAGFEPALPP